MQISFDVIKQICKAINMCEFASDCCRLQFLTYCVMTKFADHDVTVYLRTKVLLFAKLSLRTMLRIAVDTNNIVDLRPLPPPII